MANASTTAAFSGGKVSPDAATTSSEERPPPLIACRRSFPAGFNPVVFIFLVSLVLIVAVAFMVMVVDNRNGERQFTTTLLVRCGHVTTTKILHTNTAKDLSRSTFYNCPTLFYYKGQFLPQSKDLHNAILPCTQIDTQAHPFSYRGGGSCSIVAIAGSRKD